MGQNAAPTHDINCICQPCNDRYFISLIGNGMLTRPKPNSTPQHIDRELIE